RAANDGISAVIDSQGHIEKTLPRFKPSVLTATVQPRIGLTPYARVGNWLAVLLSLGLVIGCLLRQRARAHGELEQSTTKDP
ncbi:MAG TPA: hypothetical protein VFS24_06385, partial [Steroidobacteraceae bacterium]|nr:hypothetical protein [Steroidobacteraceae bacterium]